MQNRIAQIVFAAFLCSTANSYAQPGSQTLPTAKETNVFLSNTYLADSSSASAAKEPLANTTLVPTQILKTGININSSGLSPNTHQLTDSLKLTPVLERLQDLRSRVNSLQGKITLESLAARQDLTETIQQAIGIIEETDLSVDFVLAEIAAEQNLTSEVLLGLMSQRDKVVNRANETSFITNGVFWAVGEGFDIPTWKYPKYSIPSGTVSIIAGVIPSIASLYAMKASSGKKLRSESEPNMLAKLFNCAVNPEVDYPKPVWNFLNSVPPGDTKTRKDQLFNRWIADSNIPKFTSRNSESQNEVLSSCVVHPKGLSIDTLNTRNVMLTQLAAEIMKMKRMLFEIMMVLHTEKSI